MKHLLERTTFRTSRLLDFCSKKELIAQTGYNSDMWLLVILKELLDNALDACEEARVAPEISIKVNKETLTISDNGDGIPPETVKDILDFSVRVSSREAYVAPDRGAQGNALKTVIAMPFVLDGESGLVEIIANDIRHSIDFRTDHLRQKPAIEYEQIEENVKNGTSVVVHLACSEEEVQEWEFTKLANDYTWLNPHLTLSVDWFGNRQEICATNPQWQKWRPSDPTSPHWYELDHFKRLVAGYIAHDADHNTDMTIGHFLSEFRGLKGSQKQKLVLDDTGLAHTNLSVFRDGYDVDSERIDGLLASMKKHTRIVKPTLLGVIGKEHIEQRFEASGCEMETFQYRIIKDFTDDLPWVLETAFAWRGEIENKSDEYHKSVFFAPHDEQRRLVTGVNWSPGIMDPFRQLGKRYGGLSTILTNLKAGAYEPIIFFCHLACPRVEYTDRGKSAIVIKD